MCRLGADGRSREADWQFSGSAVAPLARLEMEVKAKSAENTGWWRGTSLFGIYTRGGAALKRFVNQSAEEEENEGEV